MERDAMFHYASEVERERKVMRRTGAVVITLAAGAALLTLAAPAMGQPRAPEMDRAAALKRLSECRQIPDEARRLACYDEAAAAIDAAESSGELVVMDRGQVREAKRSLFGFDTSALNIFDRAGGKPEVIENVTLTVERAFRGEGGKWVMVMTDGQVWRQIDSEPVASPPKKGSKAEIRRAALGSYFLNIDGQRAIRARREK